MGFVSTVLDAGYHIELAGGGHCNAAALRSKVAEIQKQMPAGVGITLDALYINPRQFTFQLQLPFVTVKDLLGNINKAPPIQRLLERPNMAVISLLFLLLITLRSNLRCPEIFAWCCSQ